MNKDKMIDGLFGALVGDAVGVPYEFRKPSNIPPYEAIDINPPLGYNRAWKDIPDGTYSDDGSQLLCVAECVIDNTLTAEQLHEKLNLWFRHGYMS